MRDGKLYKRRELRPNEPTPARFELADTDPVTGKRFGWMPIDDLDRWHIEAWVSDPNLPDGTYELVGPKILGHPEKVDRHELVPHASLTLPHEVPRNIGGLIAYLTARDMEGIVRHHPDGRMAKFKTKDLGVERGGSR